MKVSRQLALAASLLGQVSSQTTDLPRVDLGYAIHEATSYNDTWDIYHFNNIRYAQQPQRWALPTPPEGRDEEVRRGEQPRVCPQGAVNWLFVTSAYAQSHFIFQNSSEFDYEGTVELVQPLTDARIAEEYAEPGVTEDCLFLDVKVPRKVLESDKPAPVLAWIHGGGYIWSSKHSIEDAPDPSGLLNAAQDDGSDGFVYVSMNYRLGAFGFLDGQSLLEAGGTPNVGLHDQRLALQWVQDNIHLFNGDPEQVTIGGVSAGGGSAFIHMTTGENYEPPKFKRVFSNSGGIQPIDANHAENTTQAFLGHANVSTIDEARELPIEKMIEANINSILANNASFTYGPTIDGDLIPEWTALSLQKGSSVRNVDILMGHTTHEGGTFAAPWVKTVEQFRAYVRTLIMFVKEDILDALVGDIYTGALPAATIPFFGDIGFECYTDWVARAFGGKVWQYEFAVVNEFFHGGDMPYVFNGTVEYTSLQPVPVVVEALQGYLTNFVKFGNPNAEGLPSFPQRGCNASHNILTEDGVRTGRDDSANPNCKFLQQPLFE